MRDYEYAFVLRTVNGAVEVLETLDATWKIHADYHKVLSKYEEVDKDHKYYVVYGYTGCTSFGTPEMFSHFVVYRHVVGALIYDRMDSEFFDEMRGLGRYEEFTQVFNVAKYEWLGKVQEVREELYG